MIASVKGKLSRIDKRAVVIEVGGIGLHVHVPDSFTSQCGPVGSTVSLFTHLHVREDDLSLYGCATEPQLQLFELLLSVSGIGPKVALGMLSALSLDEIRGAIATEQSSVLSSVPGIGPKTAKKVILDLKDKIEFSGEAPVLPGPLVEADTEVIAALTALGYSVIEAQTALQHVPATVQDIEERLRAALAYLGS